jgi:hypothetical protein
LKKQSDYEGRLCGRWLLRFIAGERRYEHVVGQKEFDEEL